MASFIAADRRLKTAMYADAPIATATRKRSESMETKPQADKTTLAQVQRDGKSEAEHLRVLQPHSLPSGEGEAFRMGMDAALAGSYANPQFETYSQRISYRSGWLVQMKHKATANQQGNL